MADSRRTTSRARGPRARSGPGRGRSTRPRTTAATAPAAVTRPPRPRLTGRAAVLVLVVAVLMVSYASSMRAYLQQRAHISDLDARIAERQDDIDALEHEKARWSDPAYIEAQARARFGYVKPGDTSYIVLDEDGNRLEGDAELRDAGEVLRQQPTAWWSTAWESVELAGDPPRIPKPPAAEIDGTDESQE